MSMGKRIERGNRRTSHVQALLLISRIRRRTRVEWTQLRTVATSSNERILSRAHATETYSRARGKSRAAVHHGELKLRKALGRVQRERHQSTGTRPCSDGCTVLIYHKLKTKTETRGHHKRVSSAELEDKWKPNKHILKERHRQTDIRKTRLLWG